MIVYPRWGEWKTFRSSLDAKQLAYNSTLQLFTKISPKQADAYQEDYSNTDAVEYLSAETIALLTKNEGDVRYKLEEANSRLIVESANIEAKIHSGNDAFAMMEGPWHFPLSQLPGESGNMVIFGHRFAELPPSKNTFFYLDKVRVGDKVKITQRNKISYTYTVIETKVIDKTDRSVLANYNDHRITLITCHPLWKSDERLVVVAVMDKTYRNI